MVIKFNNKITIQFGNFSSSANTSTTITYPIAFKSKATAVTACHTKAAGWTSGSNINCCSKTLSTVTFYQCDGSGGSWITVGY